MSITLLEDSTSSDGLLMSDLVRHGMESVQYETFQSVFFFHLEEDYTPYAANE